MCFCAFEKNVHEKGPLIHTQNDRTEEKKTQDRNEKCCKIGFKIVF